MVRIDLASKMFFYILQIKIDLCVAVPRVR